MVARQVTQKAVAQRMKLSPKHINQIVRGNVLPSVEHVVVFAQLMGVSPDLLWQWQANYVLDEAKKAQRTPRRPMKPTPVRRGRPPKKPDV